RHHGFIRLIALILVAAHHIEQRKLLSRNRRRGIARGDELLQPETVEIQYEILEKIGLERVIAVAKHRFTLEVLAIIPYFLLNVGELRIELILLCGFSRTQTIAFWHY